MSGTYMLDLAFHTKKTTVILYANERNYLPSTSSNTPGLYKVSQNCSEAINNYALLRNSWSS